MLEEQRVRVEDAIKKLANDIDKQRLRKMQVNVMYKQLVEAGNTC